MKEVSIVIPTYNRYHQLNLTLHSISNQDFDFSKMEVIIVDDGSSDQTPQLLKEFQPPFTLKYIRHERNQGRSRTRNTGINVASGRIIIFLDAEVIVNPDFVSNHLKFHEANDKAVATGTMYQKGVYSVLFPNFSKKRLQELDRSLFNFPEALRRYKKYRKSRKQQKDPLPLLTKEDIYNQNFKKIAFTQPFGFEIVVNKYGKEFTGYHLPWIAFQTGNVSLNRSFLTSTGNFETSFEGWGFEDWELGYRLYKNGAQFIHDASLEFYHQEHPYSTMKRDQDMMNNYLTFVNKHPNIETAIYVLVLSHKRNLNQVSEILDEYYTLEADFPDAFVDFKQVFYLLLKEVAEQLAEGLSAKGLIYSLGIADNDLWKDFVLDELKQIERYNKYPLLVDTFYLLWIT